MLEVVGILLLLYIHTLIPDVFLLNNVNLVALVNINKSHNWGFVRQSNNFQHLLEAVVLDGDGVDVGPVLGAVHIDGGLDVVTIVAYQVMLIRRQHNIFKNQKLIGEFPMNFALGEWSRYYQAFIVSLLAFPGNNDASCLVFVEKYLLNVGLFFLKMENVLMRIY